MLGHPKDMVPIVYMDTMPIVPLIDQMKKEHEDITRMQQNNPGAKFGELTAKYYEKNEKKEKEEFKRQMLKQRQLVEQDANYHPSSKAVKKRMESQHLNSWLHRYEIRDSAERFTEFQQMLEQVPKQKLKD